MKTYSNFSGINQDAQLYLIALGRTQGFRLVAEWLRSGELLLAAAEMLENLADAQLEEAEDALKDG
ncbi:MAG: hypothetical protein ROW48_07860 [Bellilinea sp.]|jgi:hypothetical protein